MSRTMKLFYIAALLFLFLAAFEIGTGHCSPVTADRSTGRLPQVHENPNTYVVALPMDVALLGGKYTNARLKPYNTPMLYDESTLFCGDVRSEFFTPNGELYKKPLSVTYSRVAHRKYQGIACHDIVAVFPVVQQ